MDALALCITEVRCKLLDGQYPLPGKPDLVVGRLTRGHCTAKHFVDTIVVQVAIALGILSSIPKIYIETGTADQGDLMTITLGVGPGPCSCLLDIPGLGVLLWQLAPERSPIARFWNGIQLLDEWLDIPPLRSQGFGTAATRIGGKVIDPGQISCIRACCRSVTSWSNCWTFSLVTKRLQPAFIPASRTSSTARRLSR